MMVEQISVTVAGNIKKFRGLAADPKPVTDLGTGSTFREYDTGKIWEFSISNINPVTSNGWWEVV